MAEVPTVEGYSDLVQVARGGFGVVYRARQDRHGRVVALKILNIADLDERARERFARECVAMGGLSWHPNVVALHDSGVTDDGHPFLAMEFLDAGSLADRLRSQGAALPWQEAVRAGVQVAGALDAAHAQGTLHRDLKPENLLVGPYGETKLGDFGIAAVEGGARTTTGHASFTLAHVAPELLRGQRPDERSDLYGLASTLHTLIAGEPPFVGGEDDPFAVAMARILQEPAPRLGNVPDDLADLLTQTLLKAPEDRPQTAADLGRALQRVQATAGELVTDLRLARTPAPPAPPHARGSVPPLVPTPPPLEPAPPPHPPPRPPLPPPLTSAGQSASTDQSASPDQSAERPPLPPPPAVDPPTAADQSAEPPIPPPPPATPPAAGDPRPTVHQVTPDADATIRRPAPGGLAHEATPGPDEPPPHRPPTHQPRTHQPPYDVAPIEPPVDLQLRRPAGVLVVAVLGAVALAAAVVVAVVATRGDDAGPAEVTATIEVGAGPEAVAATDGAVWVANTGNDTVSHIDPSSNEVTATIDVDDQPGGIAATDDAVWVANQLSGTVSRIDPTTDDVVATVAFEGSPDQVAATADAVWVTDGDHTVTRIDPATNEVTATIDVASGPSGVAATDDAVWVASHVGNQVSRIDPVTNDVVAAVEVALPESVAIADGAVWVTGSGPAGKRAQETTPQDGIVSRIDPDTNEVVATVAVGPPGGVAVTGGAAWVASGSYSAGKGAQEVVDPGVVSRIDADTNEVTVTLDVGDGAAGVAATNGAVWVANRFDGTVNRIAPGT